MKVTMSVSCVAFILATNPKQSGGADGTRTRDLRRDRPGSVFSRFVPIPSFSYVTSIG